MTAPTHCPACGDELAADGRCYFCRAVADSDALPWEAAWHTELAHVAPDDATIGADAELEAMLAAAQACAVAEQCAAPRRTRRTRTLLQRRCMAFGAAS